METEDDYDLADTESLHGYLANRRRNIDEWNEEILEYKKEIAMYEQKIYMAQKSKHTNQSCVDEIMRELASRGEVVF